MHITPEVQKIIDAEVEKRTAVLESTYKSHFEDLKGEMYESMKELARDSISKGIQLESLDASCNMKMYRPIVEGVIKVFKDNGIPLVLTESTTLTEAHETKTLLLEAITKIQEMRDMLAIHEMIESGLAGLDRGIIENTLNKFKADPRYSTMTKDDFLKEVANHVLNMKNMPNSKSVQFESVGIISDSELSEVDSLLESKGSINSAFSPRTKINIPKLRKKVLDEATAISMPDHRANEYDPAQEVLDTWYPK